MPRDPLAPVAKAADDLAAAKAAIEEAKVRARELVAEAYEREKIARAALHARMVDAGRAGVRQVEIVRASGITREAVRRILRAGGVAAG